MPVASVNGININYEVIGQGEPLVMIMGLGVGQKGWSFQTLIFKKYFQVITFDNRGSGDSDRPDGPYTTRMMADDAIGLMDYLHIEKAHILGVSVGGMVAQEIAINYPQRVNKLVLGCTCCKQDKGSSGDTPEWSQAMELASQGQFDSMLNLLINKKMNQMFYIPLMKKALINTGQAGIKGINGQKQASATHDTAARLIQIKAPTLILTGTGDKVIRPSSSEVLAGLIPEAKLVTIKNGSHTFFMEMRDKFNQEVLNFLRNSEA